MPVMLTTVTAVVKAIKGSNLKKYVSYTDIFKIQYKQP